MLALVVNSDGTALVEILGGKPFELAQSLTAFDAGLSSSLPAWTYRLATSAFLCPVCCMIKARSAPPRAAEVANPLRSEWPAKRAGSSPMRRAAFFTISAIACPDRRFVVSFAVVDRPEDRLGGHAPQSLRVVLQGGPGRLDPVGFLQPRFERRDRAGDRRFARPRDPDIAAGPFLVGLRPAHGDDDPNIC